MKAAEQNNVDAFFNLAKKYYSGEGVEKDMKIAFDYYLGPGSVMKYHNIHVVYTKEAETADQYIEKTVRRIGKNHHVTVATSDALEQVIICLLYTSTGRSGRNPV